LAGEQTVDGVALVTGDRALVKNQSAGAENGIYVVASGGWSRASDADTAGELEAAAVFVEEGTVNADSAWVMTTDDPTLGTTALTWTQFSGLGQVVAGAALTKTGNQLDVQVDALTIEISADALRVKAGGIGTSHLAADSVDSTKIAAGAVGSTQLASGAVIAGKIGAGAIVNADINAGAAIALSKLAVDPLARANHTGTQTASTISDFDTQVRTSRLDQMASPTAPVNLNLQEVQGFVLEQFTTGGRPAATANKRVIFNTSIARVQIDR
jgi:hypothetical protein